MPAYGRPSLCLTSRGSIELGNVQYRPRVPCPFLKPGPVLVISSSSVTSGGGQRGSRAVCVARPLSVAASMKHDATDCAVSTASSTTTATPHALCLPGRSFTHFASLEFLVVANVAAFVWACFFFFGDLLCLGKVRLGREIAAKTSDVTTEQTLRRATSLGIPRLAFWGDAALCFLTLVSAAATFGFLSGGDDLGAGYCDGVGRGWCDRMAAAAAFGTCAFVAYLPSVMINADNDVGPW